uniref:Uncharacterized protein n=1 Tax=Mus musculus TaxID=10090 RepID=Q3TLM8_MOUSE|nr:unnamed protein product [Mus musculus]
MYKLQPMHETIQSCKTLEETRPGTARWQLPHPPGSPGNPKEVGAAEPGAACV